MLLTTIINKHSFKYQDFGMFLSFVDVGQLVHSAYLSSSALNLACCASGGILNDELNSYLDLRNPLHHPALCLILGKPKNS
ncbi:hypothetical protein B0A58_11915 [Flavobacterium branchiophilum NBRC 15030 = ATCC 35035]|nr:hypothetical protein B0A58_11915 [Flavobacterium branchiophilum NBRC 15030 = ATCC 35035]